MDQRGLVAVREVGVLLLTHLQAHCSGRLARSVATRPLKHLTSSYQQQAKLRT